MPTGLEPLIGHPEAEHQPDDRGLRALKQELRDRRILDEQVALAIDGVPDGEHGVTSRGAGPAGARARTWPGVIRRPASRRREVRHDCIQCHRRTSAGACHERFVTLTEQQGDACPGRHGAPAVHAEGIADEECRQTRPLSIQSARHFAQHRSVQVVPDKGVGEELDRQGWQVQRCLELPAAVAEPMPHRLASGDNLASQVARTAPSSTVKQAKRQQWPLLHDGGHAAAERPDALRKDGNQPPAAWKDRSRDALAGSAYALPVASCHAAPSWGGSGAPHPGRSPSSTLT